MNTDAFALRHIGVHEKDLKKMFEIVGVNDLEELMSQTIPEDIRLKKKLDLPEAISEHEFLTHIQNLANKNKVFKSYIGLGYHESLTPSVIKRNILENK